MDKQQVKIPLFSISGDLEGLDIQDAKLELDAILLKAQKGYKEYHTFIIDDYEDRYSGIRSLYIYGRRLETDDELNCRVDEQNKHRDGRRQQYEELKKEFKDDKI